jgi:hypothetical protein
MTAPQSVLGPPLVPSPGQLSWENLGWQEPPVSLVSEGSFSALGVLAEAKGYFVVQVGIPPAHYRGRLGLFLEEAIEGALDARGALAPGIQSTTGLDASLADQLYRTRLLGYAGLAIGVPNLESIANLGRVLDADDSSVLRWWIAASQERPLRLLVHEQNLRLRVYQSPVMFEALFGTTPGPVSPRAPSVEMAESAEAMELSDLPPRVSGGDFETSVAGTRAEMDDDGAFTALDRALGLDHGAAGPEHGAPTIPCPPGAFSDEMAGHGAEFTPVVQAALFVDASDTDVHEPWLQAEEISPSEVALLSSPLPGGALGLSPKPARTEAAQSPEGTPGLPRIRLLASDFYAAQNGITKRSLSESEAATLATTDEASEPVHAEVAGAEEDPASEMAPTPLPTKKITRNPFVRFAEPHEWPRTALDPAISAEQGLDCESKVEASAESPSELPVRVLPKMPILRSELRKTPTSPEEDEEDEARLEERIASRSEALRASRASHFSQGTAAPGDFSALAPGPDDRVAQDILAKDSLLESDAPFATSPIRKKYEPNPVDVERQQAFLELSQRDWRRWLEALEGARGPRPLSAVERMFVTDYTRLAEAHRLGVADDSALEALTNFRQSFAESYTEAFDALRARGKRPTMVLDLPDMAHRIGRLQGARRVQLLLVDGLRFDLGLMLQDRLKQKAEATLTERLLLWSALPTCTSYQLELLGRGPEGLKEPGDPEEPPALVARGRAAMTPRRVRTGSLELYKLDVVEDELREVSRPVQERLPEIADRTAEAVLDFFSKQAPKTLVVVFGDHGFALDASKAGTSEEVIQGGSTPEEVLVPAFAWLTGRVH